MTIRDCSSNLSQAVIVIATVTLLFCSAGFSFAETITRDEYCKILEDLIDSSPKDFKDYIGTKISKRQFISTMTLPEMSRCTITNYTSGAHFSCRGQEGSDDELGTLRLAFDKYVALLDYCLLEKTRFFVNWRGGQISSSNSLEVLAKSYYSGQPGTNVKLTLAKPDSTGVYFVKVDIKYR